MHSPTCPTYYPIYFYFDLSRGKESKRHDAIQIDNRVFSTHNPFIERQQITNSGGYQDKMLNSWTSVVAALYMFVMAALALHLEIHSENNPKPVCIRDFVPVDEMVVVSIKTNGRIGDGQELSFTVKDTERNEYKSKKDVAGNVKFTFTIHDSAAIDICFTNRKTHKLSQELFREVELEIESGASARHWNALQTAKKLEPNELELQKVFLLTEEIDHELQYLKDREERMRDTNESTNARVKWFSIIIILALIGLGVWQIQYLRNYFRVKHII